MAGEAAARAARLDMLPLRSGRRSVNRPDIDRYAARLSQRSTPLCWSGCMADSPTQPSASVFRHRAYALFWSARVLATLAVQAESVTIGWQVYTVARRTAGVEQSALLVGMVGLVQFVPLFLLTPLAGATADRHDRRKVMLACLCAEMVCAAALCAVALSQGLGLAPIFLVAAVFGASRAFLSPVQGATGPMLVPREELPRAIAWNSIGYQGGAVIGPWVGGALCALSPAVAYGAAGGLFALAAIAVLAIRAATRPEPNPGSRMELIREGLEYVRTNKIVLGAISLDLFAVLLGGAVALLPVYARDVLKIGAHGFGVLRSGPAIGATVMAAVLSRWQIHRHAGKFMFAGVAVFGLMTLVFAVSRQLWLTVAALAAIGAADMISVYVRQSLVQIVTPDAMRGRVSAVSNLFIGASNELGEFETGVMARILGPVGAALFGGFGSLGVTGVWSFLFPALRDADRLDGTKAPSGSSPSA
jgi:MFS family permease